jgi:TPR repeat protein
LDEAIAYFKLSPDQGDPDGQINSDHCLKNGTGIVKNIPEAASFYNGRADQGNVRGHRSIAVCV